jgi:hypothetical protein
LDSPPRHPNPEVLCLVSNCQILSILNIHVPSPPPVGFSRSSFNSHRFQTVENSGHPTLSSRLQPGFPVRVFRHRHPPADMDKSPFREARLKPAQMQYAHWFHRLKTVASGRSAEADRPVNPKPAPPSRIPSLAFHESQTVHLLDSTPTAAPAPPPHRTAAIIGGGGNEGDPRINAKEREFTLPARVGPDSSCTSCPSMFPLPSPPLRTARTHRIMPPSRSASADPLSIATVFKRWNGERPPYLSRLQPGFPVRVFRHRHPSADMDESLFEKPG